MKRLRAAFLAMFGALLLLVGAVSAVAADPSLFVTESDAAPGDKVHFSISGTESDATYMLKIGDREVATGSDPAGDGVSDEFTMPDLGGESRDVHVEAIVTQSSGTTRSTRQIRFRASAPLSDTGSTLSQPAPAPAAAPLVGPTPRSQTRKQSAKPKAAPRTQRTPSRTRERSTTERNKSRSGGGGSGGSGGGSNDRVTSTPSLTTSTPNRSSTRSRNRSAGTDATTTPSGPSGASGLTPPAPAAPSPSSSPASGAADIGKSGFPLTVAIVLLTLLALAALVAFGSRLARNWRPALVFGNGRVSDDARLHALSRASQASGEVQRAIAQRRASRSTGRAS